MLWWSPCFRCTDNICFEVFCVLQCGKLTSIRTPKRIQPPRRTPLSGFTALLIWALPAQSLKQSHLELSKGTLTWWSSLIARLERASGLRVRAWSGNSLSRRRSRMLAIRYVNVGFCMALNCLTKQLRICPTAQEESTRSWTNNRSWWCKQQSPGYRVDYAGGTQRFLWNSN